MTWATTIFIRQKQRHEAFTDDLGKALEVKVAQSSDVWYNNLVAKILVKLHECINQKIIH